MISIDPPPFLRESIELKLRVWDGHGGQDFIFITFHVEGFFLSVPLLPPYKIFAESTSNYQIPE